MENHGIGVTRLDSDCLTCLLKQELDRIPEGAAEEQKLLYKQRVLGMMSRVHKTISPSEISRDIHQLQQDIFGQHTDYTQIKTFFNQKLMQYAPKAEHMIRDAADPLLRAVQFSICANYIDFGIPHDITEEILDEILAGAENIKVDDGIMQEIRTQLRNADAVVFLHDNCGEIVMDKLLIKEIRRQFPQVCVTSVVRGSEVVNDVTLDDAREVGLAEVASVMTDGDDIAGTCMTRVSEECREALRNADVILSKGQGNFETLRGCGLNVYYLFLCKCALFCNRFRVPAYTGMVMHERETANILG